MIILMPRLRENPVVAIEISRNPPNGVRGVSSRDPNYNLPFCTDLPHDTTGVTMLNTLLIKQT